MPAWIVITWLRQIFCHPEAISFASHLPERVNGHALRTLRERAGRMDVEKRAAADHKGAERHGDSGIVIRPRHAPRAPAGSARLAPKEPSMHRDLWAAQGREMCHKSPRVRRRKRDLVSALAEY